MGEGNFASGKTISPPVGVEFGVECIRVNVVASDEASDEFKIPVDDVYGIPSLGSWLWL